MAENSLVELVEEAYYSVKSVNDLITEGLYVDNDREIEQKMSKAVKMLRAALKLLDNDSIVDKYSEEPEMAD